MPNPFKVKPDFRKEAKAGPLEYQSYKQTELSRTLARNVMYGYLI